MRTGAFSVGQNLLFKKSNKKLKMKVYNTGDTQVVTHQALTLPDTATLQ